MINMKAIRIVQSLSLGADFNIVLWIVGNGMTIGFDDGKPNYIAIIGLALAVLIKLSVRKLKIELHAPNKPIDSNGRLPAKDERHVFP